MSAYSIERIKAKRVWVLYLVVVALMALNLANGTSNYFGNESEFQTQDVTWWAIWGQSGLLYSLLFLPCIVSIRAASMTRMEHENQNWRRMASYGAAIPIAYLGKLASMAVFTGVCQALYLGAFLSVGLASGFELTWDTFVLYFVLSISGWVGAFSIGTLQLLVGIVFKSYATTVAIGFFGTVAGFALALVAPVLQAIYPYTQIGLGMQVRNLSSFSLVEFSLFVIVNIIMAALCAAVGGLYLKRQEY